MLAVTAAAAAIINYYYYHYHFRGVEGTPLCIEEAYPMVKGLCVSVLGGNTKNAI